MKKGTQISILLALIVIIIGIYLIIIFLGGSKKSLPTEDPLDLYNACILLFKEEKYEESISKCQEVVNKYPDYYFALLTIGCSQQKLNRHQEALLTFQELIKKYPEDAVIPTYIPDALYYCAISYMKMENYDKAKEYCEKILSQYPDTRQWIIDGAKKLQTVDIPASQLFHQAQSFFEEEKYEEAIKNCQEILTKFPTFTSIDATKKLQTVDIPPSQLLYQGQLFFKEEKYEKAIEKSEKILEEYPNSTLVENAYLKIGVSYKRLRNFDKALSTLQELISNCPNSRYMPDALYHSAVSYFELEKYDKSKEYCEKILSQYPDTRQWLIDATKELLDKLK